MSLFASNKYEFKDYFGDKFEIDVDKNMDDVTFRIFDYQDEDDDKFLEILLDKNDKEEVKKIIELLQSFVDYGSEVDEF